MGIFSPSTRARPPEPIEHFELFVSLGIIAKACRQYRGIVALAEASLGDVAESNGRMLLETMLAANFLMQANVALKQNGTSMPDVPGYPLTTAFRAKLYLAHDAMGTLKTLRGMAKNSDVEKGEASPKRQVLARAWHSLDNNPRKCATGAGAQEAVDLAATGTDGAHSPQHSPAGEFSCFRLRTGETAGGRGAQGGDRQKTRETKPVATDCDPVRTPETNYARQDSNLQPTVPKTVALSS